MSYLPTVSWVTVVNDVVLTAPNTYRVTVVPIDVNDPGANPLSLDVGYYLKDYIGHTYSITEVNVDGNPTYITINDDFSTGVGPQQGQYAYIYQSVGDGSAPYLAPIRHRRLDLSALDYSRSIELAVLWEAIASGGGGGSPAYAWFIS
jgi:hypothetical protein